jgi:glycosyltransferase involved in cell wall biosynthesis
MNRIEVTVVMSVYNGESALEETLRSILDQKDAPPFEFIVVDDGSTDGTGALLDAWAHRDSRLRVIHQANAGLTRALARGCSLARGEFIARQDCGDASLPDRLARQWNLMRSHPEAVLTACAVQVIGPGGEQLFVSQAPGDSLHEGLGNFDGGVRGPPHHGATMFSRSAYERTGGYREFFVVAQDIDLWLRLRELGRCIGDEHVGYIAPVEERGISAQRRDDQLRFAQIATDCARARQAGQDDAPLLVEPPADLSSANLDPRETKARFLYFVGACLSHTNRPAARRYFWRSFRASPRMLKSLLRAAIG